MLSKKIEADCIGPIACPNQHIQLTIPEDISATTSLCLGYICSPCLINIGNHMTRKKASNQTLKNCPNHIIINEKLNNLYKI